MPKKTVNIFVVHNDKDEWLPDDIEPYKIESICKNFKINKGTPIKNLRDMITSLTHKDANNNQIELINALNELNNMVGMENLKEQIINQLLFFIQDLQEPDMFLHTVLTGPPGSGKTTIINVLSKIYTSLGILKSNKIIRADRASLIGKWLGSTAIKTKDVLDSALGGILILDEVYSLGNKEQGDSFSKECIDTINQYLSEHMNDFICVIAGYKTNVEDCFFSYNPGLARRFPWRFEIDDYKISELHQIMKIQLENSNWGFSPEITSSYLINLFQHNKLLFSGNGGDTKNLIDKCKIAYARRIFTTEVPAKKLLNHVDIEAGLDAFKKSKGTEILDNKHMYI